jgi:hypothetical protein
MKRFFEYIKLLENEGKSQEGTVEEMIQFLQTMPPNARATVMVQEDEPDQDDGEEDGQDANGQYRRPLDNI